MLTVSDSWTVVIILREAGERLQGAHGAGWPQGGADQHADDAVALLRELDAAPATVLGFSSGGVIVLVLAARHPDVVTEAIAWEPPALSVLPDGLDPHAQLLAPSRPISPATRRLDRSLRRHARGDLAGPGRPGLARGAPPDA